MMWDQNSFIWTERRTGFSRQSLFTILRTRLKIATFIIADSSSTLVSYSRHASLYEAHGQICNLSVRFRNNTAI